MRPVALHSQSNTQAPGHPDEHIFLTGITGGLGSWLACEALRAGAKVVALVRADTDAAARERVQATLKIASGGGLDDGVHVVRGDLCSPGAAVDLEKQLPAHVTRIVHCAASTQFHDLGDARSHEANVEGTRAVLDLAQRRQLPLVHVSSAYVAGKRTDVVGEDETDAGQEFNNAYEHTKFLSEMDVRKWAAQSGLPVTILRPSIVMGDSRSGRALKFNGLYDFIRVLDLVVSRFRGEHFRVPTTDHVTKNIIPLDYFAKAAWHIISRGIVGCYHLTNPDPLTMRRLGEIFSKIFDFAPDTYQLVELEKFAGRGPNPAEQTILDAMGVYLHYMTSEPKFDRTNANRALAGSGIALPRIQESYFRRLLDYARAVKWGKLHT